MMWLQKDKILAPGTLSVYHCWIILDMRLS